MRNENLCLMRSFSLPCPFRCLESTYEEWKRDIFWFRFNPSNKFLFRIYLWGMKTQELCQLYQILFQFRIYLWGMKTPQGHNYPCGIIMFRIYLWGMKTWFRNERAARPEKVFRIYLWGMKTYCIGYKAIKGVQ
jgi:hypothetical protein